MPISGTPTPDPASVIIKNSVVPVSGYIGASSQTTTANAVTGVWFRVPRAMTVNKVDLSIGAASGNGDFGIYSTTDFATFTRLASTGSTAIGGTGVVTFTFTSAVTLQSNTDYFFWFGFDNATASIFAVGGSGTAGTITNMCFSKTSSFPLPASITGVSGGNRFPIVRIYNG